MKRGDAQGLAQGIHIDFAFHTLGWFEFQNLCASILREVLGQTVQVSSEGNDAGIDASFEGTWKTKSGEVFSGTFIAQIKFSRDKTRILTRSLFSEEIKKAKKLVADGLCDNYFVLTNHKCTFTRKIEIEKYLKEKIIGVKYVKIYGPSELRDWIRESSRLRMLVPRIYGIGDISLLLNDRAICQAGAMLKTIGARLKTIVPTDSYHRAAEALKSHGFVLLIGNPMTGKTTIGYALSLAAADYFDREVFMPATPAEFKQYFDPANPRRFYWIDDAFGETIYDQGRAFDWNRYFNAMEAAISAGCKIVFTSRTYIWEAAKKDIKQYSFKFFEESTVLIDVKKLTLKEKEKMLYNHIRMGNQSIAFKAEVKPFCENIAKINEFLPESARRLADSSFTKKMLISSATLQNFFEEPMQILIESIEQLGPSARALLAIIFANGAGLTAPVNFSDQDKRIAEIHGVSIADVLPEIKHLNESFIRQTVNFHGTTRYVFAHPTFRDALADIYSRDPELLRLYITGADIVNVIAEVSCGNVGIKGIKVMIAPENFNVFLEKFLQFFNEYNKAKWTSSPMPYRSDPKRFLAHRCSKEFLRLILRKNPEILELSERYVPVSEDASFQLILRLQEFGILNEKLRINAIEHLISNSDTDISFMRVSEIMDLFVENERERLIDLIQNRHILNLEAYIDSVAEDYMPDNKYGSIEDSFTLLSG